MYLCGKREGRGEERKGGAREASRDGERKGWSVGGKCRDGERMKGRWKVGLERW